MRNFLGILAAVLSIIGLVGFAISAIQKVLAGEGSETYFTGYGVKFDYTGALIVLVIVLIIFLIAPLYKWWSDRGLRDLKRKYSGKDSSA